MGSACSVFRAIINGASGRVVPDEVTRRSWAEWTPEDFASLISDVSTRVSNELPDDTWPHPGHDATPDAERPHLDQWCARGR